METFANWPPSLSPAHLQELKVNAVDYAVSTGVLMKADPPGQHLATHAPFALFPSPYPQSKFETAKKLQPLFNELIHRVSQDVEFMDSVFSVLSQLDEFTGRLYQIWKTVRNVKNSPKIHLGIHRSDYMLHSVDTATFRLLQVEINTIASSFGSLSTKVSNLHSYLSSRSMFRNEADPNALDITRDRLPENKTLQSIAHGLYAAWKAYDNSSAIIMMVVQPGERNLFDQRLIEYELAQSFGVGMIRKTLSQIDQSATLKDGKLFIDDTHEISVVYYRAGYGPGDYPSEKEWNARMLVETSNAVKCPSVEYQLAGAKKVQQVLAEPKVLEKYRFLSADECEKMRECFAGIFPLDGSVAGLKAREMALRNPERYVMKPQREGGGNNFYGSDIAVQLKSMSEKDISAHILMERIIPPPYKNFLVKKGELVEADVVSELGIYGIWLSSGIEIILNETGGQLLRTKAANVNEGGVAAGFAVIDSPLLF